MKRKLFYGSLLAAGIGAYALFRDCPEQITIGEYTDDDKELRNVRQEEIFLIASDGLPLALTLLQPNDQPIKAVVQIVHGILEHRKRYLDFARFLAENGYAVIVSDNRGHRHSVDERYPLGHMAEPARMIQDQYEITQFIKKRFTQPLYLYGHSFGSILARLYLQEHDDQIAKLLLTGTVQHETKAQFACAVAAIANRFVGERRFSWIIKKISDFDAKDKSWLTNSEEHLQKAIDDPWMIPGYDNRGTATIWQADHQLKDFAKFRCQNPELPIFSITGAEDSNITGGEKGLLDTENTLRKIGYRHIDMLDLPKMKHEVLNEVDNQLVYQLILDFFNN